MARYATGKKSKAISDITGFKVNYPQLKTTWDNLRVEPEEFDIKHPQLTPAKNVFDATALFNPRPDTDQEITNVVLGYNYDIFTGKLNRPSIGVEAKGGVGRLGSTSSESSDADVIDDSSVGFESTLVETGLEATGQIGTVLVDQQVQSTGIEIYGYANGDATNIVYLNVTVQDVSGSNKYFIDGTQQATLTLYEGNTYRLNQGDSSNSGHPLRFSTTSNGSHGGGSEYTTGVATSGTPGTSGAHTLITVASGAVTLYYYCTQHSAMGGTANTPSTQPSIELTKTATQLSATAELGSESLVGDPSETGVEGTGQVGSESINIMGWGQEGFGESTWGDG